MTPSAELPVYLIIDPKWGTGTYNDYMIMPRDEALSLREGERITFIHQDAAVVLKIDRVIKNLRRNLDDARVGDVTLHVTREDD